MDILGATPVAEPRSGETVVDFIRRQYGQFDHQAYCRLLGAANEFKEGDAIIGVAAADAASRRHARQLLGETRLGDIMQHPPHRDQLYDVIEQSRVNDLDHRLIDWTFADFKQFLLTAEESEIQTLMPGLASDVIGCVVKLMSHDELVAVGAKIFNPLPDSDIGSRGFLGARVQPNSPTDHPDDIRWQVYSAFSYAVGDLLLGTNPVSSEVDSVAKIERTLQEILTAFSIADRMPHCVLSHIDVQAEVEKRVPGSTELWFQSIAGTDGANATFDVTVDKMLQYAQGRTGRFGLYFETGQGADFTNGHGNGFDMVLHEARKYGFARALQQKVAEATGRQPWVHLNDVAGFIGPEVFRTREQLVRCCLEDIVMGKLHGLCLGLDVCSTLHMEVSLDDLDWCLDQILPANPAYLMALPTKIDPMLGYLTTGFQDHVRLREKFGYRVGSSMWQFYQQLGVIDDAGQPTDHFGDPLWVYLQFCRRQGDERSDDEIRGEGQRQIEAVRGRGVFVAEGHGRRPSDLEPKLAEEVTTIYEDGKESIWAELTPEFLESVDRRVDLDTRSADRTDYILHPESGEQLTEQSTAHLQQLALDFIDRFDTQIVISDGLNAHSIMDPGHLEPFLDELRDQLRSLGLQPSPDNLLITSGRVRAGYRVGETLFSKGTGQRSLLHVIGERPGTGHHTFSVYITVASADTWSTPDRVDHDITKVVSGIANTALKPRFGAQTTARILGRLIQIKS